MSRELEARICAIINELDSWGCRPQIVTAASPFVARTIKTHFPDIETRASVNMRLTTLQAMKYLSPWFDSYYIGRDIHRDLSAVKRISEWAHANGKKVGILANSGCLRNCPWQTYHDNLVAHSAAAMSVRPAAGFNPHLCWTMYENPENFPEILKATWIRPEDIHRYEPYVDFVKLATRQHSMFRLVAEAYVNRSFKGNLLDLLEPGFAPAFGRQGVMLDNSAFPSDWAERVSHCSRECTDCGYCDKVFEVIRK
jgi:collagenase-like PrtC family protease